MDVPAIRDRPNIRGYEWLWDAYLALSTCRAFTMGGPGPIPWTAIHTYSTAHALNVEEDLLLNAVIPHVDTVWFGLISDATSKTVHE